MRHQVRHKLSQKTLDVVRLPPSSLQDLLNLNKATRIKDYIPKIARAGLVQAYKQARDNMEVLIQRGVVEIIFKTAANGEVEPYYRRTEIGEAVVKLYLAINSYVRNSEEKMSLRKTKYTKTDYDQLVQLPLELKILRSQKAILKACLAFDVLLHKGSLKHASLAYGQTRHVAVLHHLVSLVKETLANVPSTKLPQKILSSYSIESVPDIFNEWAVNGCYNEDANVNFPLAIWTKKDYTEYIERFMQGDENANIYFNTNNDKSD